MNASTQANSDLETPQLLGALKHYLYLQKSLFTFNMQKILKQDGLKNSCSYGNPHRKIHF